MIKTFMLLTLGFTGLMLGPNLATTASAETTYCCRDRWLIHNLRISTHPCPGFEAPGKCQQHYCLNADTDKAWRQKSGVYNCDGEGYNYQISEEDYKEYVKRGQVVLVPQ